MGAIALYAHPIPTLTPSQGEGLNAETARLPHSSKVGVKRSIASLPFVKGEI
ncbi:MAG: hypothetical protein NT023_18940 [Armatimonadetes bacterium]|nr:hypothetical protein [Armatimonadota bacterium]